MRLASGFLRRGSSHVGVGNSNIRPRLTPNQRSTLVIFKTPRGTVDKVVGCQDIAAA